MEKFKLNEEVYYNGFNDIYIIVATKQDKSNDEETQKQLEKWDYLITKKDSYGTIQVKENLLRKYDSNDI